MATRPDPLSPAAFGIDTVGVLTRRVSPGQGLVKEVKVSLARVRFGEDVATRSEQPAGPGPVQGRERHPAQVSQANDPAEFRDVLEMTDAEIRDRLGVLRGCSSSTASIRWRCRIREATERQQ